MSCSSAPHTCPSQETADQPPDLYCPPGAPFGPVHFTKYPPNPAYLEFTLAGILIHDPEARTRETEVLYREGTKIIWPPLLFQDKYNFLPTYLVPMTPPLTLRPNRLQESVTTNESTSTQVFGVMYITLTRLIDSMVPVSRPWAVLGKLLSYIVKLAPILWWALPAGPAGCLPASSQEPPTGWIPDRVCLLFCFHYFYKYMVAHESVKMSQVDVMVYFAALDSESGTVPINVRFGFLHPI
ncbi:hypothetical protein DSO57_1021416 [Entomophthora muscae]|uniref:Uncharacterized protein n=1 Tax=Entomophthora muscae TaxID=34485 RepID=A0ACC2SGE9_9FUNG|nr:hypothetical protein DSO57_1021416 [Entomophthora muscae]